MLSQGTMAWPRCSSSPATWNSFLVSRSSLLILSLISLCTRSLLAWLDTSVSRIVLFTPLIASWISSSSRELELAEDSRSWLWRTSKSSLLSSSEDSKLPTEDICVKV